MYSDFCVESRLGRLKWPWKSELTYWSANSVAACPAGNTQCLAVLGHCKHSIYVTWISEWMYEIIFFLKCIRLINFLNNKNSFSGSESWASMGKTKKTFDIWELFKSEGPCSVKDKMFLKTYLICHSGWQIKWHIIPLSLQSLRKSMPTERTNPHIEITSWHILVFYLHESIFKSIQCNFL